MAMLPLANQPLAQELTDAISFLITTTKTENEAPVEVVRRAAWKTVIEMIKNGTSDIRGFHALTGTEFAQLTGNLEAGHLYLITEQSPNIDSLSPGTMWLAKDALNFELLINLPVVNNFVHNALDIAVVDFTMYEDGTIECNKTYDDIFSMITGGRRTVIAYFHKENDREVRSEWDKEQTSRYEHFPDDLFIEFRFEYFNIVVSKLDGVSSYPSTSKNNRMDIVKINQQLAGLNKALDATIALQQQILVDAAVAAE